MMLPTLGPCGAGPTLSAWFLVDRNASDFGTCLNRRFCNAKLDTFLARAQS